MPNKKDCALLVLTETLLLTLCTLAIHSHWHWTTTMLGTLLLFGNYFFWFIIPLFAGKDMERETGRFVGPYIESELSSLDRRARSSFALFLFSAGVGFWLIYTKQPWTMVFIGIGAQLAATHFITRYGMYTDMACDKAEQNRKEASAKRQVAQSQA